MARGELGEVRRLETDRGSWAVKQAFEPLDRRRGGRARGRPACSTAPAGRPASPTPEPMAATRRRRSSPRSAASTCSRTPGSTSTDPDTGLDPAAVGALVARLHAVPAPGPRATCTSGSRRPIGAARVEGRAQGLARRRGAVRRPARRACVPALLEVESILTPMQAVQTCHLDLWSDNLRRTTDGELCVIDFDNAGPGDPSRELAMVLFEFGRGDAERQRRAVRRLPRGRRTRPRHRPRGLRADRRAAPPHRPPPPDDVARRARRRGAGPVPGRHRGVPRRARSSSPTSTAWSRP